LKISTYTGRIETHGSQMCSTLMKEAACSFSVGTCTAVYKTESLLPNR